MKNIVITVVFMVSVVELISAQKIINGTYMNLRGFRNHEATYQGDSLLISPCQRYESQLSANKETFIFKKNKTTGKLEWKEDKEVLLSVDEKESILSVVNPYYTIDTLKFMLIHPQNSEPDPGILTYYDHTDGGYSAARILVTNKDEIKSGNCFIHSIKSDKYHKYIVGTLIDNDSPSGNGSAPKAVFNADFTGNVYGLPIKWSIVSDNKGKIKVHNFPEGRGFGIQLIVEYIDKIPFNIDKVPEGRKVGVIDGFLFYSENGEVEYSHMKRKL